MTDPEAGPRIIGVVQCKNEWGLIGVAISHALANHVDEVHVVDDGSTDLSAAGFEHLKRLWGDRLHILHLQLPGYHQEAVTNTAIAMIAPSRTDWIYVFDADEFLVVDAGSSLRAIIAGLAPGIGQIVYPLDNFIVADDFDPNRLSRYRGLSAKSIPVMTYDFRQNQEAIRAGRATFFDVPFLTKVIYRHSEMIRLKMGAHNLLMIGRDVPSAQVDGVRCCHVPFPSLERLERKARMGERHIRQGRKPSQGWQSQMLYHLQQEGRLDWFWRRHRIARRAEAGDVVPAHVEDRRLATTLEPTLALLAEHFRSDDLRFVSGEPLVLRAVEQSHVPLGDVVRLTRDLQNQTDHLIRYAQSLQEQLAKR